MRRSTLLAAVALAALVVVLGASFGRDVHRGAFAAEDPPGMCVANSFNHDPVPPPVINNPHPLAAPVYQASGITIVSMKSVDCGEECSYSIVIWAQAHDGQVIKVKFYRGNITPGGPVQYETAPFAQGTVPRLEVEFTTADLKIPCDGEEWYKIEVEDYQGVPQIVRETKFSCDPFRCD